jgi:hypothetical protein
VSNLSGNMTEAVNQSADAIQHVIEGTGKTVEMIVCAAQRNAATQLALYDSFRCVCDCIDASEKAPTKKQSSGNSQQHKQDECNYKAFQESILNLRELVQILAYGKADAATQIYRSDAKLAFLLGFGCFGFDIGPTKRLGHAGKVACKAAASYISDEVI